MSNRFANPKTMPAPRGYTQVVETTGPGRTVYLSGQLGMTPGGALVCLPSTIFVRAFFVEITSATGRNFALPPL